MPSPAIHLHLLPRALSLAATSGPPTQPLLAATSPRLLPDSRSGAGGTGAAAKASARWSMALPPSSSAVGAGAAEKAGFVQLSRHHPCTREARPPTGHRRPLLLRSFSPLLVRERKTLCEKQGLKRRLKHGPKRRAALSVFYLRIDEGFVICSDPKNFSMVYVPVVHCIRGRGQQESKRALRCDGSTTQHQVEHTGLDGKRPVPSETYICQDRVEWQPGFCLLRFFVGLFVAVSLTNKALMQTIVNDELDVAEASACQQQLADSYVLAPQSTAKQQQDASPSRESYKTILYGYIERSKNMETNKCNCGLDDDMEGISVFGNGNPPKTPTMKTFLDDEVVFNINGTCSDDST